MQEEQVDQAQATDIRSDREREPDDDPHDAHQGQPEEAVHDRRQHVLAADEATVEQCEARQHDHDEGRRHEEPGGVSGVHAVGSPPTRWSTRRMRRRREGYGERDRGSAPWQDRQRRGWVTSDHRRLVTVANGVRPSVASRHAAPRWPGKA